MKIFLGSDHRGFRLKEQLKTWLTELDHEVVDCGNTVFDPEDDFPDFAFAVAEQVIREPESFGILLCGSGGGMVIAANKVRGIRAAQGMGVDDVIHNRSHNNINILTIAADEFSFLSVKTMVEALLETPFEPEAKFQRRLNKISQKESP